MGGGTMKSVKYRVFSVGIPLMLTALLVLMFITFSLLGFSTARGDLERAELLAERTADYYSADNRARQVLRALETGADPGVEITAEEGLLHYAIPMNEGQSLWVTLSAEDLTVLRWQTVND